MVLAYALLILIALAEVAAWWRSSSQHRMAFVLTALAFTFSFQLSGTLPSSLGALTALQTLDMSRNNISGVIPPSLGSLTNLRVLVLVEHAAGDVPERHNAGLHRVPQVADV